jgi:hypothetical protein
MKGCRPRKVVEATERLDSLKSSNHVEPALNDCVISSITLRAELLLLIVRSCLRSSGRGSRRPPRR